MKSFLKKKTNLVLIILLLLALVIRVFSLDRMLIERVYSAEIYPGIGKALRFLFGWLPFSIGDVIYSIAAFYIIWKIVKWIRLLVQKKVSWNSFGRGALKLLTVILAVYIIFNLVWGLNYNRAGIRSQIEIKREKYSKEELIAVNEIIVAKINAFKEAELRNKSQYPTNGTLYLRTDQAYLHANQVYPFLKYSNRSIKTSFFGWLGNYMGFTGYYNPLTGEAQVNTTVPDFLKPYVCVHEVAHQLGYAKENEANFVGYLVASTTTDSLLLYSTYFDLFLYSNRNLYMVDSVQARHFSNQLHPEVKNDIRILRVYLEKYENPIEPAIRWMYGKYLQANEQPSGVMTYNEVIADLIAYYRKYKKI
ncbi:MAG: DUF3810 domain-containing protein [Bacteroidetes bacterium]|nr:MAG: DUF3810 domain-containing protein [Bacteroidota bacterium]